MDVSVIIVNYNTRKLLAECIETIYKLTKDIRFEVNDGDIERVL